MRKIIAIGESVLDNLFVDDKPVKAFVGGRISNAVASLGRLGMNVTMVSECCTDHVGDMVVDFWKNNDVSVGSVDRYTDGSTPLSMIFENGDKVSRVNYVKYPEDRFDVVWPRIDENDIVLFGSFYSIDPALRERLFELVTYAVERKAIIIYLPGCQHGINCRITKVMTAILENLEIANIVVTHSSDLEMIYPGEGVNKAYRNHIEFYGPLFVNVNDDLSTSAYCGAKVEVASEKPAVPTRNLLGWQSGLVAGIIHSIFKHETTLDELKAIDAQGLATMLSEAKAFAENSAASDDNCITRELAASVK